MKIRTKSIIKKTKVGLLLTTLVFILVSILQQQGLFQRNEWMIYDWFIQKTHQQQPAPDNVAVILIDDASLRAMDPIVGRWPWPRSVYAEIIDFIAYGRPKAVLFDILFSENQYIRGQQQSIGAEDSEFVRATNEAGFVFHSMQLINDSDDESNKNLLNHPLPKPIQTREKIDTLPVSSKNLGSPTHYNNFLIPFNGLYQAAKGIGVVTVNADKDGVLRRSNLFHTYRGENYPSLSVVPIVSQEKDNPAVYSKLFEKIPGKSNSLLLNYYSSFRTYSMSGILSSIAKLAEGDIENMLIDPLEFENTTIFIGASALGLNDLKKTPVSDKLPGVFLHATAFSNINTNNYISPANVLVTYIMIAIAALLTSISVLVTGKIVYQIIFPVLIFFTFILFTYWQYQGNQVVVVLPSLVSIAITWACAFTWLLFTEEKEKRKVRKMFSQYVSPAALEVMIDQHEEYRSAGTGSKEVVSILFSDIRGFTTLSEHVDAEIVVKILNYYLANMTEVILKNNGTIDKFIGDAIMAIWGAPVKSTSHPLDAVKTAMEMFDKLEGVNTWLINNGLFPIDIGIGVNTGEVVLGSIGSEQKADYTVIGDNVNQAARLEGITKTYGCKIIISESTRDLIKHEIPCILVDMVKVKGKDQSLKIFTPVRNIEGMKNYSQNDSIQASRLSEQAFNCYQQRDWDSAIDMYERLPTGPLQKLHITRCEEYKQTPPSPDWDGSFTMTSK